MYAVHLPRSRLVKRRQNWLQIATPSVTMFVFLGFAFCMATMVVLSIIPLYLNNDSVEKTSYILTTVRISNYVLQMGRSIGKRATSVTTTTVANIPANLTADQARAIVNASIESALEQQLKIGDNRDSFNIYLLAMTPDTDNTNNMSVTLDFLIAYTRECASCNAHRQMIVYNQLCSSIQLSTPIRFFIQYRNLSFILSDPITVFTPSISFGNISVVTRVVSAAQFANPISTVTNGPTQMSSMFLAINYTLTVMTSKTNYFATLDVTGTQTSANQNDGPVPFAGALTMYSPLAQTIQLQAQFTNAADALNITINNIILEFWYLNSTVQVVVDFLATFATSCNVQCTNIRRIQLNQQLGTITTPLHIQIQPANLTDGQVGIWKNGVYTLFDYSLTAQVIGNFSGNITSAVPPLLTVV